MLACSPELGTWHAVIRAGSVLSILPALQPLGATSLLFWEGSKCTRKQHSIPGVPGFGSTAMETFRGPLGEWSRIHPSVSPCPHESLWDLILVVAVLVQGATGAEQDISLPKIWGTVELFLRVRYSGQRPGEQTYVILGWWQKGDIEGWEPAERYSPSSAFDLFWPSRSTGEHWTAQQPTSYLDFCHRWAGSENSGKKSKANSHLRDFPQDYKILLKISNNVIKSMD